MAGNTRVKHFLHKLVRCSERKVKMTNYFWCRVFNSKSFMEKVNKLELYNKQNLQQFEKLYFMLQIVELLKNIENLTSSLGKSVN